MFEWLKRIFALEETPYQPHPEAVITACFFNPQNSPYRLMAFHQWYKRIRHLNHRIVECLIGPNTKSQLPGSPYITQVHADDLLWHKESLLNFLFKNLPSEFNYVFWLDTDILFTNNNWLVDAVRVLQHENILQPFEYCIHLDKNRLSPNFDVDATYRNLVNDPIHRYSKMWRSFCANYVTNRIISANSNYDVHGHVGFAWGARRQVINECPLYDKAIIGGADHILAHAVADQIPHSCITRAFMESMEDISAWSHKMSEVVNRRVGYVLGDLYHIWHGDISERRYLQRVKDLEKDIKNLTKDRYGFYSLPNKQKYIQSYYRQREIPPTYTEDFGDLAVGFLDNMGYTIAELVYLFGQPCYEQVEANPEQVEANPEQVEANPEILYGTEQAPENQEPVPAEDITQNFS